MWRRFRRVDPINAAAQNGDDLAACVKGALVACRVDTERHAAEDALADADQAPGSHASRGPRFLAGGSGTHDGAVPLGSAGVWYAAGWKRGGGLQCQCCQSERFTKEGHDRQGSQVYCCSACKRRCTEHSASAFTGYRFPPHVIALAVRWYLRYRLSYADLAELLGERGIYVDPSTIYDWVQHFTPLYQEAARAYRRPPRGKWSVDETYIKVGGVAQYVFRAIDEDGQVIDVFVSPSRDTEAAITFLQRALDETDVRPQRVTTDRAAIYPPALAVVLPEVTHVASKREQQAIERDHQHLKGRYRPMRGFKQPHCAQIVCAGHGFMRNLRDGFYRLGFVWCGPGLPHPPRLLTAWQELTAVLCVA